MKSGKLYFDQISSFRKLSPIQFISVLMSTQTIKPCELHNNQFTSRRYFVSSNPLLSQERHSCSFIADNKGENIADLPVRVGPRLFFSHLEAQTNRIYDGASNTNRSTDGAC